jgi:hypothetical protein
LMIDCHRIVSSTRFDQPLISSQPREHFGGGGMPAMADVAKRAGVAISMVCYALNGTRPISEETRQRVFEAMAELGYHPNFLFKLCRGENHPARHSHQFASRGNGSHRRRATRRPGEKQRQSRDTVVACRRAGDPAKHGALQGKEGR